MEKKLVSLTFTHEPGRTTSNFIAQVLIDGDLKTVSGRIDTAKIVDILQGDLYEISEFLLFASYLAQTKEDNGVVKC